jgi:lysyl endopeptidase
MKKLLLNFLLFFSPLFFIYAQQGDGGKPVRVDFFTEKNALKPVLFSEPNIEALKQEDAELDNSGTAPWRFGFNNHTNLSTLNSGQWKTLDNGDKIWRLYIQCENALTINLTFSDLVLPDGNQLYIYNPKKYFILGKFTQKHTYQGKLGAELVPGSKSIVEYYVPFGNSEGYVNVCTVTHGYRTAIEFQEKAFGSSGACNMNVNCTDGLPWQQERNGAVMLVSGSNGFCSGSLINNTQNDGKPYVLTANHCYSDPTSWIFRFNWQAVGCMSPASSPSFQSLSGAVLRSRRTPSDFCLVEITGGLEGNTVPLSFQPYFCGWNNANQAPTSTVSIHHPSGDIKKISFDDDAASAVQAMGSSEPASSWQVAWDRNTTTEGGSSGSPLFDQNHRIIGQLWGGGASCQNLNAPDYYGRLHNSWDPSGSNSTNQLKHWLDPNSSGVEFIDGYDPSNAEPVQVDAGLVSPNGVSGTFCGGEVTPSITIQNNGLEVLTTATITYGFDGSLDQSYDWVGSLSQWQSEVVTLPTSTLGAGQHSFSANIGNLNAGSTDENDNNNEVSGSFNVVIGGQGVDLNLTLDCYGSETSWSLLNESNEEIYISGGYQDDTPGLVVEPWCLNDGCYTFNLLDSYGDGLFGGFWCGTDGSVSIIQNGEVLAELLEENANFGDETSLSFCIGENSIETVINPEVSIFPNPSFDIVNIVTNNGLGESVEIINGFGQTVGVYHMTSGSIVLDASNFSKGIYFALVSFQNGSRQVLRLIKE